ncbi:beta/alpha barrel domain-containing protein [Micromonospora rubida]|uniref:hypothetical protein n=1 Tax=Micromonospora rubida TaxID=2697657 RepID=UPI0013767730|nr:hypothetical protein [Micromonospora rubida]NBE80027.1 hypothetical protein [Micromonospora rubida]
MPVRNSRLQLVTTVAALTGVAELLAGPTPYAKPVTPLAAVSAPFRQVSFVPTGGIDVDSAADYLALPSALAMGDSWMVPHAAIAAGEFDHVADLVAAGVAAVARRTRPTRAIKPKPPWPARGSDETGGAEARESAGEGPGGRTP